MQNSLKSDKIAYAILQRKLKEYINLESEKEAPIIRFEGFSDAWELRKLGEIADVTKLAGFEFTKYVSYKETGEIIALRGLNVKNGRLVLNDVKYIDESDFSKLNRSKLYKNDILFTYVGTVGELAIVQEDDKYYLAPNVARIRINSDATPIFVTQMMNDSNFYRRIIFPLIATSSQPALSMENVRKFDLIMPVELEQQKIGLFFQHLDNTITLHQRKLDKLKQLKQGYLQQLFPQNDEKVPRVRFENFEGNWILRKLSTGMIEYTDRVFIEDDKIYKQISVKNIGEITLRGERLGSKIGRKRQAKVNLDEHPITLIFTRQTVEQGGIGFAPVETNDAIVTENMPTIDIDINVFDKQYLSALFKTMMFRKNIIIPNIEGGTAQIAIHEDDILSSELLFPSIDEQKLIGSFFKNLNHLITLNQSKLDKLKSYKQALLQKMFI